MTGAGLSPAPVLLARLLFAGTCLEHKKDLVDMAAGQGSPLIRAYGEPACCAAFSRYPLAHSTANFITMRWSMGGLPYQ